MKFTGPLIAVNDIEVSKKFLKQGLSVEKTAKRTMHPIEFVRKCL